MWQALFAKTQSALLGSMKTSPSDKETGNTLPFARPPLYFSCNALSIICIPVVFKDLRFLCGCPTQGMWLTQCHSGNSKALLKEHELAPLEIVALRQRTESAWIWFNLGFSPSWFSVEH